VALVTWLLFLWSLLPACPPDMVRVRAGGADICIDRYEAPNEKGAMPLVMQSLLDAEAWCEARGKRVPTEDEWEMACRSTDRRPWSRGFTFDRTTCNNGSEWLPFDINRFAQKKTQAAEVQRLFRGSPSGSFLGCQTPEGVFDLDGNVEEWVVARKGRPWRGTLKGGFWAKPWPKCWDSNDAHEPTFRFYETGFRCVRDTGL